MKRVSKQHRWSTARWKKTFPRIRKRTQKRTHRDLDGYDGWRSHTARDDDSAYIYMRLVLALPTIADFPEVVDCPLSPEHIAANFSLE